MAFTKNLIEGNIYLLSDPSNATTLLKENIVEAKVEKLSVLSKRVKVTFEYLTMKPVTMWIDVATIKTMIIDNVEYTPQI